MRIANIEKSNFKNFCPFQTLLGAKGNIQRRCSPEDCALWLNFRGYQGCAFSVMAICMANKTAGICQEIIQDKQEV